METRSLRTGEQAPLYSVYVFGSCLRCDSPLDLDLLIVYADWLPAESAVGVRSRITDKIRKYTALPIHAILLSEREESEVQFIRTESCRPLTAQDLRDLRRLARSDSAAELGLSPGRGV